MKVQNGTEVSEPSQADLDDFNARSIVILARRADEAIPKVVTIRQAKLALSRANLLASVNAAIAAMPDTAGDEARITWEFASEVRRTDPLVATLSAQLGLTNADLDALFITAATL